MVAPRAHHHHHSHSTIPTLVDEDIYPLLGGHPFDFLLACFILNAVGQCFLLLLTATLLFSNGIRKRNWTLINLLIVSILSSIPPSLLYDSLLFKHTRSVHKSCHLLRFYSGNFMNPAPPLALCLTQAVLKHGSDTMFVFSSRPFFTP